MSRSGRSRRALQGAGALVAAVVMVLSHAPSAHAATPTPVCDPLQLCLYSLPNSHGELQVFTKQPVGTCLNVRPSLAGQVSSISNRTDQFVTLFAGDGCTGASTSLSSGVGYPNMQVQKFDNKLRSIEFNKLWTPESNPCASPTQQNLCLYDNPRRTGEVQAIGKRPAGTCVDLQPSFTGRVSSFKNQLPLQDLALFAGDGCTGASYTPGTVSTVEDLGTVGFDNVLRSVRFLQVRPDPDPCGPSWLNVCVYVDATYAGALQAIPANQAGTCVVLQPSLTRTASSVRNNARADVVLYTDTRCAGDSVTFRRDVPDLAPYEFDNQAVALKFTVPPPTVDPCDPDSLCLFADADYAGERQVISEDVIGTCVNVQATLRGNVSAVANRSYGMVLLFTGDNCTGTSDYIDASVRYHDLTVQGFDNKARSVRYS
jgi:hypothetical protein